MNARIKLPQRLVYILIVFGIVLADQFSKWCITQKILPHQIYANEKGQGFVNWMSSAPKRLPYTEIEVTSFFNIVMVWNTGISFGMLNTPDGMVSLAVLIGSVLISLIFLIWMLKTEDYLTALSLAFIVGGAFGNIIDRLRFGAVIDFLDFHIAGYHWPAFNLADSVIVIGVFGLILQTLFFEKKSSYSG